MAGDTINRNVVCSELVIRYTPLQNTIMVWLERGKTLISKCELSGSLGRPRRNCISSKSVIAVTWHNVKMAMQMWHEHADCDHVVWPLLPRTVLCGGAVPPPPGRSQQRICTIALSNPTGLWTYVLLVIVSINKRCAPL